jgi:hypothetical protein
MDSPKLAVVVAGIFVLLVIFIALRYRSRIKAGIKGPFGMGVDVEASNDQPAPHPGVTVAGAKSHAGGLRAEDRTGRGADVKDVDTYGDIQVTSDPNPKAEPPA